MIKLLSQDSGATFLLSRSALSFARNGDEVQTTINSAVQAAFVMP
jgi:hypothetical protein